MHKRSIDRLSYTPPARHVRKIPVHPDTHRMAGDIIVGNHAHTFIAAVATVVPVVRRHEINSRPCGSRTFPAPPPSFLPSGRGCAVAPLKSTTPKAQAFVCGGPSTSNDFVIQHAAPFGGSTVSGYTPGAIARLALGLAPLPPRTGRPPQPVPLGRVLAQLVRHDGAHRADRRDLRCGRAAGWGRAHVASWPCAARPPDVDGVAAAVAEPVGGRSPWLAAHT